MRNAIVVVGTVAAFGATVGAQQSAATILANCGATLAACQASSAGGAFCVSQYLTCIAPDNRCGCQTANQGCVVNPPAGGIVACGPALANCIANCTTPFFNNSTTPGSVPIPTGTSVGPIPIPYSTGVVPNNYTTPPPGNQTVTPITSISLSTSTAQTTSLATLTSCVDGVCTTSVSSQVIDLYTTEVPVPVVQPGGTVVDPTGLSVVYTPGGNSQATPAEYTNYNTPGSEGGSTVVSPEQGGSGATGGGSAAGATPTQYTGSAPVFGPGPVAAVLVGVAAVAFAL